MGIVDYGIVDTVRDVDRTFLFIFSIAAVLFIIISLCLIVILIRYNHKRHSEAASFKGNVLAELIWIIIPSLIVFAMFVSGWRSYLTLQSSPADAMQVKVTAKRWSWLFSYENGRVSNMLYVPVNRAVVLSMTSLDVLHSFYAPAFRIKRDTVPGMTTSLWFRSRETGSFVVTCAEYCGQGHSKMRTKIIALTQDDFDRWYAGGTAPTGEDGGKELFIIYGCAGCHPEGKLKGIGPPLEKVYGSERVVVTKEGEKSQVADEPYLRRSIIHPQDEIVKGYEPIMPSLRGQVSDQELDELIAYLKSLS
jgi:cytochrome c oxidase subunit II